MLMYSIEKRKLLEMFLEVTHQLEQSILKEDYEGSAGYFEQRDVYISQIDELDHSVGKDVWLSAQEQLLPLLKKIEQKDRTIEQLMKTRKEEAASELRKINMAKKRNQSYQDGPYNQSAYFFDKKINPR